MSPSSSPERRVARISLLAAGQPTPDPTAAALQLSARLDHAAARDLHGELLDLRGATVSVDGTGVAFCGALAAQILVAAARETLAAGGSFGLRASAALVEDLSRLGVLNEFPDLVEVAEC